MSSRYSHQTESSGFSQRIGSSAHSDAVGTPYFLEGFAQRPRYRYHSKAERVISTDCKACDRVGIFLFGTKNRRSEEWMTGVGGDRQNSFDKWSKIAPAWLSTVGFRYTVAIGGRTLTYGGREANSRAWQRSSFRRSQSVPLHCAPRTHKHKRARDEMRRHQSAHRVSKAGCVT